jgi:hypothetical protein
MKKENDIRVEMVRMEGDVAPFVRVDYLDKDAQEHSGLFLLDSGSTVNMLSSEMAECIGALCKIEGGTSTVMSISQDVVDVDQVRFSFAFGGKQFHETFCLSSQPLPIAVKDMTVLGLLGNEFLQQHRLVIDYYDYTLHTSEVSPSNLSISDCSFFFPMEIGLEFYGLPVLAVKQNGVELVALVDTGSTSNMIANQALMDKEFKCKRLKGKDVMRGVGGQVDVDEARVWFNVLSLDGDDVCELSRRARFLVLPYNVFTLPDGSCDTKGEQIPPIELLFGSPFLAREEWTLDFGAKIMYKRKVA